MTILIVEDDERIFQFVKRGLEEEGYLTEVATTGGLALEMAKHGKYDLVLLDLMLPDLSGQEVCLQLRQHGVNTPIMILTAIDALEDKVAALRMGADDYLTKPFAFDELIARVQALLRRNQKQNYKEHVTELTVGPLILNKETREVYRDGRRIELTSKQFILLEYLMSSPGRVLSRSKLLDHVWGYNADPLTNVVEVFIRNLRRKIDDDFPTPLIKTVRGFGYKLEDTESTQLEDTESTIN